LTIPSRNALALIVALAIAPQMLAGTWLKTVAEAQKVAKAKNQLILVDMFAEWCGWCHRFESDVFPSAVFQKAASDLVLLRLDTEDGKEGTQMSRRYGVTSLPTFLLLTPDLAMAGTIRGYAPPNDFVRMLAQTRAKHESFLARVKDEGKLAKDYAGRLELAKEFAARHSVDESIKRLQKLTTEKAIPAGLRDEAFYQLALMQATQDKLDDALKTIKKLQTLSRLGEAVERAQMLSTQIYVQQGKLQAAHDTLLDFRDSFPNSPHMPTVEKMLPEIERRLGAN
jgi:thioredoxin-related protein